MVPEKIRIFGFELFPKQTARCATSLSAAFLDVNCILFIGDPFPSLIHMFHILNNLPSSSQAFCL